MKGKLWLIVLILGGLSMLSSQGARAATDAIELIVNVRVSNLDPSLGASVSCRVSKDPYRPRYTPAEYGSGFARIPLRNGSYSGNVRVRVTVSDVFVARRERGEMTLSELRYHRCRLRLGPEGGRNWTTPSTRAPHAWARPNTKAPFTPELMGTHRPTGF
jgi:hypothetical protein